MIHSKADAFFVLSLWVLIFAGLPLSLIFAGLETAAKLLPFIILFIVFGMFLLELIERPQSIRQQMWEGLVKPPIKAVEVLRK